MACASRVALALFFLLCVSTSHRINERYNNILMEEDADVFDQRSKQRNADFFSAIEESEQLSAGNSTPAVGTWSQVTSSGATPLGRKGHSQTLVGNTMLVFGGCLQPENRCFKKVVSLDIEKMAWSDRSCVGDLPPALQGHSATLVHLRKAADADNAAAELIIPAVYVLGGFSFDKSGSSTWHSELYLLTAAGSTSSASLTKAEAATAIGTASLEWKLAAVKGPTPMSARQGHTATLIGPYIFVFGGYSDNGAAKNSVLRLRVTPDPVDGKYVWSTLSAIGAEPSARRGHVAAFLAGRYYLVFGGYDTSVGESVNDLHVLDLVEGGTSAQVDGSDLKWVVPEVTGSVPLPRQDVASALLEQAPLPKTATEVPAADPLTASRRLLLLEGCAYMSKVCFNDANMLVAKDGAFSWSKVSMEGSLPSPREGSSGTLLPLKGGAPRVLLFGGGLLDAATYNDLYMVEMAGPTKNGTKAGSKVASLCPGNCSGTNGACVKGECVCSTGFSGLDCSNATAAPASIITANATCPSDCSSHGVCTGGKCACSAGFSGLDCSVVLCASNCSGQGSCTNGTCVCNSGFSGDICDEMSCSGNCSGHGTCDTKDGTCTCSDNYSGDDCATAPPVKVVLKPRKPKFYMSACPRGCAGHGTCTQVGTATRMSCQCVPGWGGMDCGDNLELSPWTKEIDTMVTPCSPKGKIVVPISNTKVAVVKTVGTVRKDGEIITLDDSYDDALSPPEMKETFCALPASGKVKLKVIVNNTRVRARVLGSSVMIPQGAASEPLLRPASKGSQHLFLDSSAAGTEKFTVGSTLVLSPGTEWTEVVRVRGIHVYTPPPPPLPCKRNCSGTGTCNNGTCICKKGYKGVDCSEKSCPKDCSGHGGCAKGVCICSPGWMGADCSAKGCPRNCTSEEQGVCDTTTYACICVSGFSGPACGINNTAVAEAKAAAEAAAEEKAAAAAAKAAVAAAAAAASNSSTSNATASDGAASVFLQLSVTADNSTAEEAATAAASDGVSEAEAAKTAGAPETIIAADGTPLSDYDVGATSEAGNFTGSTSLILNMPLKFDHAGADLLVKLGLSPPPLPLPLNPPPPDCECNAAGGECKVVSQLKRMCFCYPGWKGAKCDVEACVNNCTDDTAGTCTSTGPRAAVEYTQSAAVLARVGPANNASLADQYSGHSCVCNGERSGEACEVLGGCAGLGHGCGDHGQCSTAEKRCVCEPGWAGPMCNKNVCPEMCGAPHRGLCKVLPRGQTGASQTPLPKDATATEVMNAEKGDSPSELNKLGLMGCICRLGWTGTGCNVPDPCPANCTGHGTCFPRNPEAVGRHCVCDLGWGGDMGVCSERVDAPCPGTGDCSAHGKCMMGECVCEAGWKGSECQKKEVCTNNCTKHGVCKQGLCHCDPGYSGDDCSLSSICPKKCNGHGECVLGTCACMEGFSGLDCGVSQACPANCSGHGECLYGRCLCEQGFKGKDCSVDEASLFAKCANNCTNNGMCHKGECFCYPGFKGTLCEEAEPCPVWQNKTCGGYGVCKFGTCFCGPGHNTVDCQREKACPMVEDKICNGKGVCVNGTCFCKPGQYGAACDRGALCPGNCSRNGFCQNGKCMCDIGFTGKQCHIPLPCVGASDSNPTGCSGHGRCLRGRCFCAPAFQGKDCSISRPCPNNCSSQGSCLGGVCYCEAGFKGPDCSLISNCSFGCSGHGNCIRGGCNCLSGWVGANCDVELPCPNQCSGHGQCLQGKCVCDFDYSGAGCSIGGGLKRQLFGPQCPKQCSGHGVCDAGTCDCTPGWKELDCGTEAICPFNCSGHGMCSRGSCFCDPGFSGRACGLNLGCPGKVASATGEVPCNGNGVCAHGHCFCNVGWKGVDCKESPAAELSNLVTGEGGTTGTTSASTSTTSGVGSTMKFRAVNANSGTAGGTSGSNSATQGCPVTAGGMCSSHGTCITGGQCSCSVGWYGAACDQTSASGSCPNQCSNRGICPNGACLCTVGWKGADCSTATTAAQTAAGLGVNGTASNSVSGVGVSAGCPVGCGTNSSHGQCTNGLCLCQAGWTGPTCSLSSCPDQCTVNADGTSNGLCYNGKCACSMGFGGDNCAVECPNQCSQHGQCLTSVASPTSWRCYCQVGRTGEDCSEAAVERSGLVMSSVVAIALVTFVIGLCCIPLAKDYWKRREIKKYMGIIHGDGLSPKEPSAGGVSGFRL